MNNSVSTNVENRNVNANASAWAICNPYSNAATQLRVQQLKLIYAASSQARNQLVAAAMGIQSQQREGSVKKCKKGVLSC